MRNDFNGRLSNQVVLGIVVIGLGFLFLLDNIGIFDVHRVISFWPLMFIVFGGLKITDSRSPSSFLIGGALIAAGVLMTMSRLGYFYFGWHSLWPLFMIVAGIAVIMRASTSPRVNRDLVTPSDEKDAIVNVTAFLGGYQSRIATDDFRGGEITVIMGGCELDLRQSQIKSEAVLNVFAACGGISIKVPPDWTIILQGMPILGGFDEKTITPPDTSKRLIIKGYAIMGGLEVRN